MGISFEVQRKAFGTVLVIGPGNYPLFLPAVHSLHALIAGNAVLLKPAPGTADVALGVRETRPFELALIPRCSHILPDSVAAAQRAIAAGVDKVIFTGSSENGRDVLARLARTNTPAVMELSGEDVVLVLADADARTRRESAELRHATEWRRHLHGTAPDHCRRVACGRSCRRDVARRSLDCQSRGFLMRRRPCSALSRDDLRSECRSSRATSLERVALARSIPSGFVLINDLIVPTADPRMPFGGVKASGFGVTRGDEGLLEMTHPHVVAVRRGRVATSLRRASLPVTPVSSRLTSRVTHGRGLPRLAALRSLFAAAIGRTKERNAGS